MNKTMTIIAVTTALVCVAAPCFARSKDKTAGKDARTPIALRGARVYAFGDSIVYGHNAPEKCFMRLLAQEEELTLTMCAKNGATIIKSKNHILPQIQAAPSEEPDFVVFDGYTNDAYAETLSKLGSIKGPRAQSFDNSTFCGGFEETLSAIKQKWPHARIVFVTIHKSSAREWDIQVKLRALALKMCDKWGVTVADVFADATLDTRDNAQLATYIIGGKGSHPNEAGVREFYLPVVKAALERAGAAE
ncbi:MAG: SGNH/GDSL hydrolase family protein [Treponema sp.]|nr:SGNH/GDSL hydrolase family protein [Treponema sp.]